MIRIGITGQIGFVGTHLYNTLKLYPEQFAPISFDDEYFESSAKLETFVRHCDVIVHLAAVNRHNDPSVIYNTNTRLVKQLIGAMENTGSRPHVIFSSSTQEDRDNPYGRSKKEGREMLADWATRNNAIFTGLVIPNVFGPFGNPHFNSVIATFSHQLTRDEEPKIDVNGHIKLIYVADLVKMIQKVITDKTKDPFQVLPYGKEIYVTEILEMLKGYKEIYLKRGIIPELNDPFELNLFNTFRSYIDPEKQFPFRLDSHSDPRGTFVELMRLGLGGQVSFSTSKPGITRGNHFHSRKIERFAVIKGNARIQLRRIGRNKIFNFNLSGEEPSFVDMPIWYTHNITNTGTDDLYTIFWSNEFFDPNDPDTFFESVEQ